MMGRFSANPGTFGLTKTVFLDGVGPVTGIGAYSFRLEIDTGGPPLFNIYIYDHTGQFVGSRSFQEMPVKNHVRNFCNKFSNDESYRQKWVKT